MIEREGLFAAELDEADTIELSSGLNFAVLGCTERERALYAALVAERGLDARTTRLARVIKLDRHFPLCLDEGDRVVRAELWAGMKKKARSLAAVGDWVVLDCPPDKDMPRIVAVLERKHALVRKEAGVRSARGSRGARDTEQTIAANVDTVFVLAPLNGEGVDLHYLERMLIAVYECGATPVIVLTKADEAVALERDVEAVRLRAPGVTVIVASVVIGSGIDEVRALISAGSTAVLLGKSGVGKSSLVNALLEDEVCEVGAVRARDNKGRHTTVSREVIAVPGGGVIIDTPGLRTIQIWDVSSGLDIAYADVLTSAEECRFRDCTHNAEPGCAVVAAVEAGLVARERLESYRFFAAEAAEAARLTEEASWR